MGFFKKLKDGLKKTRESVVGQIDSMLQAFTVIDDELFDELEELLVMGDVGVETANKICGMLRVRVREKGITKPAKIMDEIEAALDEVNVDRFAAYLRNLTESTQFILITHRRGTMEEADVLYGVTMQDEGISKLLELRASEVAAKLGMKTN